LLWPLVCPVCPNCRVSPGLAAGYTPVVQAAAGETSSPGNPERGL